jgi:hypothetical protein
MGSGRELRQHDVSDFLRFCTELAFPGKNFAPGCPRNGKCQLARPIASPAFRPSAAFARNSRAPTGRDSSKLFAGFTHMPFCIVEFVGKHCTSSNTTFLTSARGGLLQLLGSSLSACCRYRPAKVLCRLSQIAALHAAFAPSRRARAFGVHVFEATCAFTFVTAR